MLFTITVVDAANTATRDSIAEVVGALVGGWLVARAARGG